MKKHYELGADIDVTKLLAGLKNAKEQAEDFDNVMSSIGNYGNLSKLVGYFKGLSDTIEEMQGDVNAVKSTLGESVKGGLVSSLDGMLGKMAEISKMSQAVFAGLSNIKLKNPGASDQMVQYAKQLNMLFKNLGIDKQIDIDVFNTKDVKQQFDELIGYASEFGKEIKITIGNIDTTAFENLGGKAAEDIHDGGKKISKEIQNQIDAIKQKTDNYERALKRLKEVEKNAKGYNRGKEKQIDFSSIEDPEKYTRDAIDNFNRLDEKTKDFRTGKKKPGIADIGDILDYTDSILTLEALRKEDRKGKNSALKFADNSGIQQALRSVFDNDDSYTDWVEAFEAQIVEKTKSALTKAVVAGKAEIRKLEKSATKDTGSPAQPSKSDTLSDTNKDIDNRIKQYKELTDAVQAYATALSSIDDKTGKAAQDAFNKLEAAFQDMSFSDDEEANDNIIDKIYNVADDIARGKLQSKDIPTQLANILGVEIPQAANKAENAVANLNSEIEGAAAGKDDLNSAAGSINNVSNEADEAKGSFAGIVDEMQHVENMALRIKKAFDMTHDADVEYRVTVNGQDMDVREGLAKSVDQKTIVESYLANIQKGITVGAHSHRGQGSGFSASDISEAIDSQYSGINALSAVMGAEDITTLNFDGVSKEIANKILEKIKSSKYITKLGSINAENINKIAHEFNVGDIAKSWSNKDGFQSLAQYIHDVEKASQQAIQPVDRLKNLLKYLKPDIDLSKYADDLEKFSNGSASAADIYNKIAKSEKIGTIASNTDISTLTNANERLIAQQEEYKQKLADTKITYQEILEKIKAVQAAGGSDSAVKKVFGDYFNDKDLKEVTNLFEFTDPYDIARQISGKFGVSDEAGIFGLLQTKTATEEMSLAELKALLSERENLLKRVDTVEDTKDEDTLRERAVNEEIRERIRLLEQADATQEADTSSAEEVANLSKANAELKEKNNLLEEENAKKQESLNKTLAEKEAAESALSQEKKLTQELSDRAASENLKADDEKKRADLLDQENVKLREQLDLNKQIAAQDDTDDNKKATSQDAAADTKKEIAAKEELANTNKEVANTQKEINHLEEQVNSEGIANANKINAEKAEGVATSKEELQVEKQKEESLEQQLDTKKKINSETKKQTNNESKKGTSTKQTKKSDAELAVEKEKSRMGRVMRTAERQYNNAEFEKKNTQMVGEARKAYQEYAAAYNQFKQFHQRIVSGKTPINETSKKLFDNYQLEAEKALKALNSVQKASEKMRKNAGKDNVRQLDIKDTFNLDVLSEKMKKFALETEGGKVSNMQFEESTRTLTYELNKGNGTIEKMAISVDEYSNSLVRAKTSSKGLTTAFGEFAKVMNQGALNVFRYVSSFVGFYEIINQVRKGITYVKEIDSALTDLKKVTDETSVAYDKFLDKMSRTAGIVGSTVADLTTMAAEWARLGYSLQEAGELAESTAILLNVSEFQDATTASEALISTIQAFGYAANESMTVVDILNEVGEILPVDNYIG